MIVESFRPYGRVEELIVVVRFGAGLPWQDLLCGGFGG
jgi:hypothetical protein